MSIEQFPVPSASSGTVTSVAGGVGITNTPEPIVSTGTVDLDINSLTTEAAPTVADLVPIVDVSVGTSPASQRKITIGSLYDQVVGTQRVAWTQYQGGGTASTATPDVGSSASAQSATTTTAFQDSTGAYIDMASTTIADTNGIMTGPADQTARITLPVAYFVVKTGASIATLRFWFILSDVAAPGPFNSDDPAGANIMGFRGVRNSPSAGANDTNWQVATKDTATLSLVDSGVAIVANTRYVFKIDASAGSPVVFSINGVQVASTSSNLPVNTAGLRWFAGHRTREAVAKSFRFAKFYLRHN